MAFRAPDTHGRFYAQAASNAPSTTSLLPPSARAPQGVQAAFARAPPSIRTVPSLNSLVRLPHPLSPPLNLFHPPERLPVLRRNRRPVNCITSTVHLQQGRSSLPPLLIRQPLPSSSPSHPTPNPGELISLRTTPSPMIFSIIPTHDAIGRATTAAAYLLTEA